MEEKDLNNRKATVGESPLTAIKYQNHRSRFEMQVLVVSGSSEEAICIWLWISASSVTGEAQRSKVCQPPSLVEQP
jgi:hypothetical protein